MSTGIVEAYNKSEPNVRINLLLSVAQTLALEVNNNGRFSRNISPMNQAKDLCGTLKRTKRGVLIDYVAWLNEFLPGGYEAKGSVKNAITVPAK